MSLKDSLANIKGRISNIRDNLVSTLRSKNVEVNPQATLNDVANAVKNIQVGQKVVLGQIEEGGVFQPLKFDGTTAIPDGNAEQIENCYTWNNTSNQQ